MSVGTGLSHRLMGCSFKRCNKPVAARHLWGACHGLILFEGVAELILSKFDMPYKAHIALTNVKTSDFLEFCNTLSTPTGFVSILYCIGKALAAVFKQIEYKFEAFGSLVVGVGDVVEAHGFADESSHGYDASGGF